MTILTFHSTLTPHTHHQHKPSMPHRLNCHASASGEEPSGDPPPRPRRIILVWHWEREGNVDEDMYTKVADPKIELTAKGVADAEECGRRIRAMMEKDVGAEDDWKLYFYVSPYKRTLQTLRSLATTFERPRIVGVREEPRLREQDFEYDCEEPLLKHVLQRIVEDVLAICKSYRSFENRTIADRLPLQVMTPSPSKSSSSTRTVRSNARLSFKALMASQGKGKGKAASSLPPVAPKVSEKGKRKCVEIVDVDERPLKKAFTGDTSPLAIFIPDDTETASLAENLEGALSSHWLTFQQLRSGQGKLTLLLQDTQREADDAKSKLDVMTQRMKDAKDRAMVAEDHGETLQNEMKSQEDHDA